MSRPRNPFRDDDVALAVAAGQSTAEMASYFGLSRSRIWRLVNELREMGRLPSPTSACTALVVYEPEEEWVPIPIQAREIEQPPICGPRPRYHYDGGFAIGGHH